jgi:hypothetical protein
MDDMFDALWLTGSDTVDVKPYNNEHSRYTRYIPELNHTKIPDNFSIDFGGKQNCIKDKYIGQYDLKHVSPTQEFTKTDFALLHQVWKEYKSIVQTIFDTVFAGNANDVGDSIVKRLCILVRIISQILCKVYPYNTNGFYDQPLFNTASETGTESSIAWANDKDTPYYGDHWVSTNDAS